MITDAIKNIVYREEIGNSFFLQQCSAELGVFIHREVFCGSSELNFSKKMLILKFLHFFLKLKRLCYYDYYFLKKCKNWLYLQYHLAKCAKSHVKTEKKVNKS